MNKKHILFFIGIALVFLCVLTETASAKTWYVDDSGRADFTKIQDAIWYNETKNGDTIIVGDGTYIENVNVNKSLTIRSENGSANCIIQAKNPNDHVFEVTANYVNISGFMVRGATSLRAGIYLKSGNNCNIYNCVVGSQRFGYGIYLSSSTNNTIKDNVCPNNIGGIFLEADSSHNALKNNICNSNPWYGIGLKSSDGNIIENNTCSNSENGINLGSSSDNNIVNNICSNNLRGIRISNSINNTMVGNRFERCGIVIYGGLVEHFASQTIDSNVVNGKPIYYYKNTSSTTVPEDAGQIIIANCSNMVVKNIDASSASIGIELAYTTNSTVRDNICNSNKLMGIYLSSSSNNVIRNNSCKSNNFAGISVESSNNVALGNNTCWDSRYGVSLFSSSNSVITKNAMLRCGIIIFGSSVEHFATQIMDSNTANGKPIYYYKNTNGITVPEDVGQVIIANCSNIVVKGVNVSSATVGIQLAYTSDTIIKNNTFSNNWPYGIYLYTSSNNAIYLNNFIKNSFNTYSRNSTNVWLSPKEITYIYKGSTYTNYLGNYWSDYTGSDAEGDGIGDTPYPIESDNDNYPLIEPFESYNLSSNEQPKASFAYSPESPLVGQEITFDASPSHDPDGEIVTYNWKFGDGTGATGINVTHSYLEGGTYEVILKVTDNGGLADTETMIITVASVPGILYVPDNYSTIQEAVNVANPGDTIIVQNGAYYENVILNKSLSLIGNGMPKIDSQGLGDAILITADGCTIRGFRCDATHYPNAGIRIESNGSTVHNNTASDNFYGIYLEHSSNNNLTKNTMSRNRYNFVVRGDELSHFTNIIDTSNTISGKPIYYWVNKENKEVPDDAGYVGIVNSTGITVKDLALSNNGEGVLFAYVRDSRIENVSVSNNRQGITLLCSSNNNLTSNTASNNGHGVSLYDSFDNTVIDNHALRNGKGIYLDHSSNNVITNNTANSNYNGYGIYLRYSSNNNVATNNACKTMSGSGIGLYLSSGNTITNNIASLNDYYGIDLTNSFNNSIYLNDFMENHHLNASSVGTANTWNSSEMITYTWKGKTYTNYHGNYWGDYTGLDENDDGIGDTPYGNDKYPLMKPRRVDVILVIDRSGSMVDVLLEGNKTKLEAAKEVANIIIDMLDVIYDRIGIVSFSDDASLDQPLTKDKDAAKSAVNSLTPGGGSHLEKGIGKAWVEFDDRCRENSPQTMIILTDGKPSAVQLAISQATIAKNRGIKIVVIGFDIEEGSEAEDIMKNSIASTPDDYYLYQPSVAPENKPPTALFTYSPEIPIVGEEITFDASFSYDPDGEIVSYEWDFGDESTGEGEVVKHTYPDVGAYTVTLTVTDDEGATDSYSFILSILEEDDIVVTVMPKTEGPYYIDDTIEFEVTVTNRMNTTGINLDAKDVNLTVIEPPEIKIKGGWFGITYPNIAPGETKSTMFEAEAIEAQNNIEIRVDATGNTSLGRIRDSGRCHITIHDPESPTKPDWSFAIIADPHIGYKIPDYDGEGWDDSNTVVDDESVKMLINAVETIIAEKDYYNIKFVVVLGDFADTAENSEFLKARAILNELNDAGIPYIPVIGDHDQWPYTQVDPPSEGFDPDNRDDHAAIADYACGDEFFNDKFWDDENADNLDLIQEVFNLEERPEKVGVDWQPITLWEDVPVYLQNRAFRYEGINFICLDFNPRTVKPGMTGGAFATSFTTTIYKRATTFLENYLEEEQATIILSHHPLTTWGGFLNGKYEIAEIVYRHECGGKTYNFGGHVHFSAADSIHHTEWGGLVWHKAYEVISTEAVNVEVPALEGKGKIPFIRVGKPIRIVQVKNGEIDYSMRLKPIREVPMRWWFPIFAFTHNSYPEPDKEIAFTAHYTNYHGFETSFDWDFGDGNNGSGSSVTHIYSQDGEYNVTLTVNTKNLITGEETNQTITRPVYVHSKHVISPLPSGLNATSLLTEEDLTQVSKNTYQPVLIAKESSGGIPIAQLGVHFEEATDDINLARMVADTNLTERKSIIHMPSWPEEIEQYKTLFIPSTGVGAVYISSNAPSLDEVSFENADMVINVGETKDNMTVTTTFYNGSRYYLVSGVTGTGGGEAPSQHPFASFTYSPEDASVDEIIIFNASSSYDPDGTITNYKWNFGDGNITDTIEPLITHSYASAGDYTVNLTVTDNDGTTDVDSTNLTVEEEAVDITPPLVTNPTATPPGIIANGIQESQLNVTVTDESGIASVNVNLTDVGGSSAQEMNNIPGTDVYTVNTTASAGTAPDTYYLQVNATDIYGNSNTSVSIALTVTDAEEEDTVPPTIESVTLDAYTTIPDAAIHVTVEATDNVGVTSVTADGVNLVETGSIWEGNITAPSATGSYTLTIRAEDAAENFAETTVDYSVVKPGGSIGIGVDPRLTTVSACDTAVINIKLVSTENFDDIAHVYLTTEGVYPGYEANLTWFNWTSKYVKVPAGAEVKVPFEVDIPAGESGYKVFYAKLESTKWTPTAMDTGVLYIA